VMAGPHMTALPAISFLKSSPKVLSAIGLLLNATGCSYAGHCHIDSLTLL
jgi:hypothetical protein